MIDGTEKPKLPLKFAKRSRDIKNLAISEGFLGVFKIFVFMGFFGDKFWSRDFPFFFEAQGNFLGSDFCPPFDHPCHLKSGVPPLG